MPLAKGRHDVYDVALIVFPGCQTAFCMTSVVRVLLKPRKSGSRNVIGGPQLQMVLFMIFQLHDGVKTIHVQ